ncbi:MAG: TetR/AcrR family transcriptional repressor of nem operon [Verrucomicrobiales bacterium]|jgi:TetR/AcrR family transcriptional repressor of nem operon
MRYPSGHKEATRRKILEAALKVFRNQGFGGGGVDTVMNEAGLTAGGFYAHFRNKEDLLIQMLSCSPDLMRDGLNLHLGELEGPDWVEGFIDLYLSPQQVMAEQNCCPLPSVISEIERQSQDCRNSFAELFGQWAEMLASRLTNLPKKERRTRAESLNTILIGTVTMARALIGTPQFDGVLKNGRDSAKRLIRG